MPPDNSGEDPQDPEKTDAETGDDCGHKGIPGAAHGTGKNFHRKKQDTEGNGTQHHVGSQTDYFGIGSVDSQNPFPEENFQDTQTADDCGTHTQADPDAAMNPVNFSRTEILPHKGGDRNAESTADHPDNGIGFTIGSKCRNGIAAKGVYRACNYNVTYRVGCSLKPCRYSYM